MAVCTRISTPMGLLRAGSVQTARLLCPSRRALSHREVTARFLDYFSERQHRIIPSSSLLAPPEAGILFANAGMNQFLRVLSGNEAPWCGTRAASLQDCIRVGGKHNDLDQVGHDGHHHTFFQMLGNWSFGDYFKREACAFAVELLTAGYGLRKEDLLVTYFAGDPSLSIDEDVETKDIWKSIGIPAKNIHPRGFSDNFWEMGTTGPCGPCTEIHVRSGEDLREIWNIVFIQYNRLSDGSLKSLTKPFVDTGMGLERICAVLQGKTSNYDTDLFAPIIRQLEKDSGLSYFGSFHSLEDQAFRMVSDHCRMVTKALSQGILPDHRDAGNKLRRVLRRSIHVAQYRLGLKPGQLANLSPVVADILDITGAPDIKAIINDEEKRYLAMLRKADTILSKELPSSPDAENNSTLSGSTAWKLYLGCGLTRENIEDLCSQRDIKNIDWRAFSEHLENFRRKSQEGGSSASDKVKLGPHFEALRNSGALPTKIDQVYSCVYEMPSKIIYSASLDEGRAVVATEETCFFPEGGGQAADKGTITIQDGGEYQVVSVIKAGDHVLHILEGVGEMAGSATGLVPPPCGREAHLSVDRLRRRHCSWHHSATHLLNAAVRAQLGDGAQQHSCSVDEAQFRLDIVSRKPVDVLRAEEFINTSIAANVPVQTTEQPRDMALSDPRLVRLPGEIYPESVRLVRCGDISVEACCGTHVSRTGEIPPVVILSSRSQGVNVKSVTATASKASEALENAKTLKTGVAGLEAMLAQLTPNTLKAVLDAREVLRHLRRGLVGGRQLLPYTAAVDAESRLHFVDRRLEQLLRQNNELVADKVTLLLSELPRESPLVGCVTFDCDVNLFRKLLRSRTKSESCFCLALRSCGQVHAFFYVNSKDDLRNRDLSADAWAQSFIDALGDDSPFVSVGSPSKETMVRLFANTTISEAAIETAARRYLGAAATRRAL